MCQLTSAGSTHRLCRPVHRTYLPWIRPSLCLHPICPTRRHRHANSDPRLCRPHYLYSGPVGLPHFRVSVLLSYLQCTPWIFDCHPGRVCRHCGRVHAAAVPADFSLPACYRAVAVWLGAWLGEIYLFAVGIGVQREFVSVVGV